MNSTPTQRHQGFTWPVRVYWEDTDAGGVVFFANYLKFFERARTEWLNQAGFDQHQLQTERQMAFVVADTSVRYRKPARLGDQLTITLELIEQRNTALVFQQQAWRGDELLADSQIRIVCVALETFTPVRIPTDFLERVL